MTELRVQNDCGFGREVGGELSQPGPIRNLAPFIEIKFHLEMGYRPSLHSGPRNGGSVGDVN
jgi:hypothetical protein